ASSMGDKEKPITIYYPKADRNINKIYQYVKDSIGNLPFEVVWEELCDGDIVSLPSKRQIQAFKVQHKEPTLTLGYKIEETRTKLKDEYKNLSTKELLQEIQKYGKSHISRSYLHPLLCYSGDTMALPEEIMQDAEVVLHDCTFLNSEDRDENTHATIDEVFANVQKSNIKLLGLFHFSTRYKYQEIVNSIQEHIKKYNVTFPVYYIYSYINGINFKQCL
ncbi:MAG TPA: MBL fold metallo-hydrolase, partial [Planctomycetota bacterium]|nr:MBL fold metallo-hydrolase [Planctomycetota bacterium]